MSGPGRRFDADELRLEGAADVPGAELTAALAAARELEAFSARDMVGPTPGFEDRVMAAIAAEAPPKLVVRPVATGPGARAFAFVAAVRSAWRVGTSGGRPIAVRAQAMAFVLLVVLATGSLASVAAIGAVNVLTAPNGSLPTVAPAFPADPTPRRSDGTSPSVAPSSEAPDATSSDEPASPDTPTESEAPAASDESAPGAGSSDDHGGPGSPGSGESPRPSRTARPTSPPGGHETPEPTETPEPAETPEPGN